MREPGRPSWVDSPLLAQWIEALKKPLSEEAFRSALEALGIAPSAMSRVTEQPGGPEPRPLAAEADVTGERSAPVPRDIVPGVFEASPDVLGGQTRFIGTRVPAVVVAEYRECGLTLEEFLSDYPTVAKGRARAAWDLPYDRLIAAIEGGDIQDGRDPAM